MTTLCLQEQEMLAEKVQGFPVLYSKRVTGFKEKVAVQNAWEKVAKSLDFAENGNFIRATQSILKIAVLKKTGALFCVQNSYKILANQFNFCRCYFGFR